MHTRSFPWLLLGLVACSDGTGPSGRLTTALALPTASARAGDTLTVTVTVTNPTAFPLTLHGSRSCLPGFRIVGAAGSTRGVPLEECPAILEDIHLAPGESVVGSYRWPLTGQAGPLPPGSYQVIGGVATAGAGGTLTAESAPQPLVIVP